MKQEFKNECNHSTRGFNAILNALELPRRVDVSSVRRLLSFLDSVFDFYLIKEREQGIRYPILFVPCAKEWAEVVSIEYLMYKFESIYDSNRMRQLRNEFSNIDLTRKGYTNTEAKNVVKWWRYKAKPIVQTVVNNNTNERNLIVCGKSVYDLIISKKGLMRFVGDTPKTSVTYSGVIEAEKQFADYEDFENVFCFYSGNGYCDEYELYAINNWKKLRNCFIIEFRSAPYCLDDVLRWGKRLCEIFPHQYLLSKDATMLRYQDFVSLTSEEAHYLFNEQPQNPHTLVPFPAEIENEIEYIIDFYKGDDNWRFSIKDRNILSLCLCDEARDAYLDFLKKDKPNLFEDEWWKTILDTVLSHFPMESIVDRIISFVRPELKAAFVICDAPGAVKTSIKDYFRKQGLTIKYYSYSQLKDKVVKERKIVVLRFCPHNLSSMNYPHKNPNSFDEFPLKAGQSILDIINELAFPDYCKYKYDYDLLLCLSANSRYRRELLGGEICNPIKPSIQYISHYSEWDDDDNENPQSPIPTVRFDFLDGTSCALPVNEVLVCEDTSGERFIDSIRNLEEYGQLCALKAIQPIGELADKTIDVFFKDERMTTSEMENKWRDELVNKGIIPQEHCREVPIWKYLLYNRILDCCTDNRLIENHSQESLWQLLRHKTSDQRLLDLYAKLGVKVQLERVLRDWCDITKVEPLIPGLKKDRENLMINYLGLNRGELSLYRKKQLLTRAMSRTRNTVTEGFLCKILYKDITDELAVELLGDSQYADYLVVDSKEDIETLKSIAEETINLRIIKTYSL